jgi:Fungal specific transcription factor domain
VIDMLISAAARFLFQLQGNLNPYSSTGGKECPSILQSHVRNLFWICHLMDKELCLRTGSPPSLVEAQCDLTPTGDLAQLEKSPEDPHSFFNATMRLSIIEGRIHNELYSPLALQQKGDSDILRSIRMLDMELEEWRLCLPESLRPSVSPAVSAMASNNPVINEHITAFQIQYHFCMIIIHQASSRCLTWMEDHMTKINGLTSSLMISVQATRSLLQKVCNSQLYISNFNFR